jgi:hypothetical protein
MRKRSLLAQPLRASPHVKPPSFRTAELNSIFVKQASSGNPTRQL